MSTADKDGYAYFTVVSQTLPLQNLNDHFGRAPDRGWSIGDAMRLPRRRMGEPVRRHYDFTRWTLDSGLSKGAPLDDHFCALWQTLGPLKSRIGTLPDTATAQINCTAWFDTWDSPLVLSAGHHRMAALFGLSIDFDFYFDKDRGARVGGAAYLDWFDEPADDS